MHLQLLAELFRGRVTDCHDLCRSDVRSAVAHLDLGEVFEDAEVDDFLERDHTVSLVRERDVSSSAQNWSPVRGAEVVVGAVPEVKPNLHVEVGVLLLRARAGVVQRRSRFDRSPAMPTILESSLA